MGFRKIITIILALLLTSGMANCICAQTNDSIANVEKQMKPLLAKAEEYGMTNIYYQTITNKALYHLREHRYLDAIAFIDKEIEHARKHFFFVLRSLIRTSDALRRRYLRSVIKEKSSFFLCITLAYSYL